MVMFKDLAEKDMDIKGMEVICQIVRRGKMLLDDRKGTGTHLRRPYAYGGKCVCVCVCVCGRLGMEMCVVGGG